MSEHLNSNCTEQLTAPEIESGFEIDGEGIVMSEAPQVGDITAQLFRCELESVALYNIREKYETEYDWWTNPGDGISGSENGRFCHCANRIEVMRRLLGDERIEELRRKVLSEEDERLRTLTLIFDLEKRRADEDCPGIALRDEQRGARRSTRLDRENCAVCN